ENSNVPSVKFARVWDSHPLINPKDPGMIYPQGLISYYEYVDGDHGDTRAEYIFKDGDKISINSPIKFYLDKTVSDLLGFEKSDATNLQKESSYFNSNENVIASNPPNLRAVDVIEIHCNIVNNSLVNHDVHSHKHLETAILYSFSPNVPHGYKISQSPQEKHYIPLRSGLRKIQQITITLVDQNNQLLQNNHVNNIVYLDLISKSQTHTYSQLW
ncbi:hypothetical protein J6590_033053, partial [Homalodisca vitripennis]